MRNNNIDPALVRLKLVKHSLERLLIGRNRSVTGLWRIRTPRSNTLPARTNQLLLWSPERAKIVQKPKSLSRTVLRNFRTQTFFKFLWSKNSFLDEKLFFWTKNSFFGRKTLFLDEKLFFGRKTLFLVEKLYFWSKNSFLVEKLFFSRKTLFFLIEKLFLVEKLVLVEKLFFGRKTFLSKNSFLVEIRPSNNSFKSKYDKI